MARSKHAPALFEVIKDRQAKQGPSRLALPKWWRSRPASPPDEQEQPAEPVAEPVEPASAIPSSDEPGQMPPEPAEPQPVPDRSPSPGVAAAPPAPTPAGTPQEGPRRTGAAIGELWSDEAMTTRRPVFRMQAGRVEISLNPVNAVVVAGCLLLALLCSYQLGARLGRPSARLEQEAADPTGAETIDAVRGRLPDPGVLGGAPSETANRPGSTDGRASARNEGTRQNSRPPAGTPQRVAGLNYVVIESFKAEDLEDAQHARQWLVGRNVGATLEKHSSGQRWLLTSVVGFNYPAQKDDCQQYIEAVKALGQMYKKEFANQRAIRYDFRSPAVVKWQ